MMNLLGEDGVAAITIIIYFQFLLNTLYIGYSMGIAPIREAQAAKKAAPPDVPGQEPPAPPKRPSPEDEPNTSLSLEYQFNDQGLGMVELGPDGVVGGDGEDEELPPGR